MVGRLNGVLCHSTVFQSYHGDSSHHSCLSWVSPVLSWGSEVFCPRTYLRKTKRIQRGSNPGPLDYESNTLPLSHGGPQYNIVNRNSFVMGWCITILCLYNVQTLRIVLHSTIDLLQNLSGIVDSSIIMFLLQGKIPVFHNQKD